MPNSRTAADPAEHAAKRTAAPPVLTDAELAELTADDGWTDEDDDGLLIPGASS